MKQWGKDGNIDVDFYSGTGRAMLSPDMKSVYQITLCLSGRVRILQDNRLSEVDAPYLILKSPHTLNQNMPQINKVYTRYNIYFEMLTLGNIFTEPKKFLAAFSNSGNILTLGPDTAKELERITILISKSSDQVKKALLLALFLNEVLLVFPKARHRVMTKNHSYISDVLLYIFDNLQKKLTAEGIAQAFFVSRAKLTKDFKTQTDMTLNEYIITARLKNAQVRLMNGQSVLDAALDAGFINQSHFIRTFKQRTGITPLKYQKFLTGK